MRIAALYDIHGNLPALEAVLAEIEAAAPDLIVIGGDVVAGPLPAETLDRLEAVEIPVRWVMGNADRLVVDAYDHPSDAPTDDPVVRGDRWVARQLTRAHRDRLAGFESTVHAGEALFCHGSPHSDTGIITAVTPGERLAQLLDGVEERLVVCGHTHHQFDRAVGDSRVVNAGSVGMPYQGAAAAFWLLIEDAEPRHRRTAYDVPAALERLLASGYPDVEEVVLRESLIEPVSADRVARHFESRA